MTRQDNSGKPTSEKLKAIEEAAGSSTKGNLIQFRLDDNLLKKLQVISERQFSSPGVLSRQWVSQRIEKEILQSKDSAVEWHKEQVEIIKERAKTPGSHVFQEGAFFVLHVKPVTDGVVIKPGSVDAQSLSPLRKCGNYIGRINHFGFESRTADEISAKAYVQVFRTGEVECVRPLVRKSKTVIDGTFTDLEIIDAAFTACSFLAGKQIALPYLILISIVGVKGYTMSSSIHPLIQVDDLRLPDTEVTSFGQIAKAGSIEPLAQTLHPSLDVLWQAAGIEGSRAFDGEKWCLANIPI